MTKTFIYLFVSVVTLVLFTACNETPKPEPVAKTNQTPANTTSYQSKQSSWQQFQSQKAMKSLESELK